jgi:alpha-L-rhamnosidase
LASGDTIVIRYAEKLDSTGNIWTENLRHAESTDRYVVNGRETPDTWWHPVFSYHGFRYAEVRVVGHASQRDNLQQSVSTHEAGGTQRWEALPTIDDFIGEVVSDAMEETGHFVSTDTILNKVYENARWGILSNYKGMPVDCPQRDERQPWLGDRTRGCFGEAFLFDNQTLYAKWARDICEAQREDGCIPDVAPAFWNYYSDDLTWAAALPMTLRMLSGHYGDMEVLFKFYPNVKRWMEHLKDCYQKDGLIHCGKYADWCVPPEREDLIHSEDPARKTDVTLISSAYYYYICRIMSGWARIQKFEDDAAWFEQEMAMTKEAFNRTFLTVKKGTSTVPGHILYPDSTFYGNNTVTANLLPYTFGMIDDRYVRQEVEKQIVKKLTDEGAITTGVIGTGWLLHALTDMGRTDLAWLLATNKKYPSWGYMAEHGATTIWELWNGDTASPKMNSGNHVMLLGDLLSWLYEYIAGIGAADVGFKHIYMRPDFSVDEIDNIDASYNSIYGKIVSRWRKEHGQLYWHVEIPANTKATLRMPDGEMKNLGSGVYEMRVAVGATGTTVGTSSQSSQRSQSPQILLNEFLYKDAPFPSCHSATIVETKKGDLVATFFGGTKERNPDVCIWVSRKPKGAKDWTTPVLVADGVDMTPGLEVDTNNKISQVTTSTKPAFNAQFTPVSWQGNYGAALVGHASQRDNPPVYREACWNPVLFETPDGVLHLYFKIGPNVAGWKGWRITSKDGGKTWSRREPLPDGIYGPIKNKIYSLTPNPSPKERGVVTSSVNKTIYSPLLGRGAGGEAVRLISPTSDERNGWKCYFELSDDLGKTWRRTAFVEADSGVLAIQPTIIQLPNGRLEALCRTRSRHIGVTFSSDNGETWSKLQLIDTPNNNSGIDAVTLNDGTFALICNDWPIEPDKQKGARTPLSILRSDDGLHWQHWVTLEDSPISQYSYPSIIQTRDGHLHAIYTWRRQRIKHVELVPDTFTASPKNIP